MAAAAALVFLLLLFIYESVRLALAILSTALVSVSVVFIGLWLTGVELKISAMMGMPMVIGIVTEINIFYFSWQQERLHQGASLATGADSEMQQPLAIAIISGPAVQLPLVLFFMPALYSLMQRRARAARAPTGMPKMTPPFVGAEPIHQ